MATYPLTVFLGSPFCVPPFPLPQLKTPVAGTTLCCRVVARPLCGVAQPPVPILACLGLCVALLAPLPHTVHAQIYGNIALRRHSRRRLRGPQRSCRCVSIAVGVICCGEGVTSPLPPRGFQWPAVRLVASVLVVDCFGVGCALGWAWYQPLTQHMLYSYYGSVAVVNESYAATEAFLGLLQSRAVDGILTGGLGDWSTLENVSLASSATGKGPC